MAEPPCIELLERAHEALARGLSDVADDLLDEIEPPPSYAPLVALARSIAALEQGALPLCIQRAEEVLAAGGREGRVLASAARAVRSVARALTGDEAGAREDAAYVRASQEAPALSFARAALAELILHARAGDRADLSAYVEARGALLSRLPLPGEATLAEGYRKLGASGWADVYRKPAASAPRGQAARNVLRALGRVAPDLAPHLDAAALTARLDEEERWAQAREQAKGLAARQGKTADEGTKNEGLRGCAFVAAASIVLLSLCIWAGVQSVAGLIGSIVALSILVAFVLSVRALFSGPSAREVAQMDATARARELWLLRLRPAPRRAALSSGRARVVTAEPGPTATEIEAEAEAQAEAEAALSSRYETRG